MRKEGKEQASRNRETFPRTPTHLACALGHHHTAEFQPRYLANGEPACSIVPVTTTVTAQHQEKQRSYHARWQQPEPLADGLRASQPNPRRKSLGISSQEDA